MRTLTFAITFDLDVPLCSFLPFERVQAENQVSSGQKLSRNRLKPTRLEANFSSIDSGKNSKIRFFGNYPVPFEAVSIPATLCPPRMFEGLLL
jgi:hypothetical protein